MDIDIELISDEDGLEYLVQAFKHAAVHKVSDEKR